MLSWLPVLALAAAALILGALGASHHWDERDSNILFFCGVVRRHPAAVRVRAAVAAADPGFTVPRDAFQHCACGRRHRYCLPGEYCDLPP
jgi:hypothetical protein